VPDLSDVDTFVVMTQKLDGEDRQISVPAAGVAARERRGWKVAKPSDAAAKSTSKEN
jgi:hypothetical protein